MFGLNAGYFPCLDLLLGGFFVYRCLAIRLLMLLALTCGIFNSFFRQKVYVTAVNRVLQ